MLRNIVLVLLLLTLILSTRGVFAKTLAVYVGESVPYTGKECVHCRRTSGLEADRYLYAVIGTLASSAPAIACDAASCPHQFMGTTWTGFVVTHDGSQCAMIVRFVDTMKTGGSPKLLGTIRIQWPDGGVTSNFVGLISDQTADGRSARIILNEPHRVGNGRFDGRIIRDCRGRRGGPPGKITGSYTYWSATDQRKYNAGMPFKWKLHFDRQATTRLAPSACSPAEVRRARQGRSRAEENGSGAMTGRPSYRFVFAEPA